MKPYSRESNDYKESVREIANQIALAIENALPDIESKLKNMRYSLDETALKAFQNRVEVMLSAVMKDFQDSILRVTVEYLLTQLEQAQMPTATIETFLRASETRYKEFASERLKSLKNHSESILEALRALQEAQDAQEEKIREFRETSVKSILEALNGMQDEMKSLNTKIETWTTIGASLSDRLEALEQKFEEGSKSRVQRFFGR